MVDCQGLVLGAKRTMSTLHLRLAHSLDVQGSVCEANAKSAILHSPLAMKKRLKRRFCGGLPGARTLDPSIKSRMLYQLS